MELISILFGVFLGIGATGSQHYEKCKKENFAPIVCKDELKRCEKYSKQPCLKK